jgi:GTP cyclohydrolase II
MYFNLLGIQAGAGQAQSYFERALGLFGKSEALRLDYTGRKSDIGQSDIENGGKLNPFITVSYAQTIDGSIAPLNRTRLDISSNTSFRLLHSLRATHDGVLVGINTVICDRPRLNVRDPLPGVKVPAHQPRPIVIDSDLRILEEENILLERPVVFTCIGEEDEGHPAAVELGSQGRTRTIGRWKLARERLQAMGGDLLRVSRDASGHCDLKECLHLCRHQLGMKSVLIEGGAGIIQTVLKERLAHQFIVTIRPSFFGGYRSMISQLDYPYALENLSVEIIESDVVIRALPSLCTLRTL